MIDGGRRKDASPTMRLGPILPDSGGHYTVLNATPEEIRQYDSGNVMII